MTTKFSSKDYKLFILMMAENGTSAWKEVEGGGAAWALMTTRGFNSQVQSVLVQASEVYSLQPGGKEAIEHNDPSPCQVGKLCQQNVELVFIKYIPGYGPQFFLSLKLDYQKNEKNNNGGFGVLTITHTPRGFECLNPIFPIIALSINCDTLRISSPPSATGPQQPLGPTTIGIKDDMKNQAVFLNAYGTYPLSSDSLYIYVYKLGLVCSILNLKIYDW
ncbi:hypothetical protein BKA70DRAFT_1428737 [Coprinopsis sp. MPI-PUGE-AT-0042]|nr:hypothetical protein BKA70DRAFT_1428737 [Coprinopsis sp. MPI-PUGE-AT-0042]